jgi:hypothetical protein
LLTGRRETGALAGGALAGERCEAGALAGERCEAGALAGERCEAGALAGERCGERCEAGALAGERCEADSGLTLGLFVKGKRMLITSAMLSVAL